jgi:hypothetical protein
MLSIPSIADTDVEAEAADLQWQTYCAVAKKLDKHGHSPLYICAE